MAGLDGSLGSTDRGDNVTLGMTAKKLFEVGGFILNEASRNLQRGGNVATGDLDQDMYLSDLEVEGLVLGLNLMIPKYGLYIDQGVNGTKKSHGSPFSYKSKKPPFAALLPWAKLRVNRTVKYSPVSKGEVKDNRLADERRLKSLVFAIRNKIFNFGIKPTKFFSKAVAAGSIKYKELIAEGLKIDIINSLKDGNNNSK